MSGGKEKRLKKYKIEVNREIKKKEFKSSMKNGAMFI